MTIDFRGSLIAAVLGDRVYVLTDVLRYLSLWVVLLFYCSFGVCVLNVDLTFFFNHFEQFKIWMWFSKSGVKVRFLRFQKWRSLSDKQSLVLYKWGLGSSYWFFIDGFVRKLDIELSLLEIWFGILDLLINSKEDWVLVDSWGPTSLLGHY